MVNKGVFKKYVRDQNLRGGFSQTVTNFVTLDHQNILLINLYHVLILSFLS